MTHSADVVLCGGACKVMTKTMSSLVASRARMMGVCISSNSRVQMGMQKGTSRLLQKIRVSIPAKCFAAVRVLPTGVCNRFVNLCWVPLHVFFTFESSSKQFSSKHSESVLLKLCVKESDPQQTSMTMSFSAEGGEVSMRPE